MGDPDDDDSTIYLVVVNEEKQYSIWPSGRELPLGWEATGFQGNKAACVAELERLWAQ